MTQTDCPAGYKNAKELNPYSSFHDGPTPRIQRVAIDCTKLATAAYARGDSKSQYLHNDREIAGPIERSMWQRTTTVGSRFATRLYSVLRAIASLEISAT